MKKIRTYSYQTGMTLVEIMIAMLVGVFLIAGILQIFISAKQAYRLQDNLSRLQENGRTAIDAITKDVRMAGYADYSCLPVTASSAPAFGVANATCCASLAGTDVIRTFQWLGPKPAGCPPNPQNSEISYFINNSSNTDLPSLWRYASLAAASTERVEGIENLKVWYGLDTDATPDYVPNYYVPIQAAWTATDWAKVVSVRITLVAITPDNGLAESPQPYTFNGTTITPPNICTRNGVITASALPNTPSTAPSCTTGSISVPDTRIRRVFSSTIAVRNRLL